jgi:predicted transcriptional regulator
VRSQNTAQPKATVQPSKTAAASGVNAAPSFKDPYGATKILLLIAGIILLIAGVATISQPLDWLYWLGMDAFDRTTIFELTKAVGLILGGSVAIGARGSFSRKTKRYKKYLAIIGAKSSMPISELASAVGVTAGTAQKDLQTMVEKGYFGPAAYIDMGSGELVVFPQARPQQEKAPEQEESQYQAILREIRRLNDDIADVDVSERIYRIEDITAKIFATVEEKPEKLPEIKSFMSYYLPTTLKLLDSYATMERQGIDGENIAETKSRIEHILDTLVKGFEQQLDQLFKSDMLDITSDIDVLESMMAKDGLTEEQNPFHQVGGH